MTSRGYSATQTSETGTSETETYGGWGPAPRGPGGRPPRRPGKPRTRVRAALGASALLVCAGVAAAVLLAVPGGSHRRGSPVSAADAVSVRQSVTELASTVAQSATDRSRVIAAIDGVQNCSLQPAAGQSALESVIADRRRSVTGLQRIAAGRIPATSPAADDLMTTLNAAISDDVSYLSWMSDIAGGHASCGGDPAADPNFAAAQAESARTNADKQQFVSLWNPLAARYRQPTYKASDF